MTSRRSLLDAALTLSQSQRRKAEPLARKEPEVPPASEVKRHDKRHPRTGQFVPAKR